MNQFQYEQYWNMQQLQEDQKIEILFIEGVHFNSAGTYLDVLKKNTNLFDILQFYQILDVMILQRQITIDKIQTTYKCIALDENTFILQRKYIKKCEVCYWVAAELNQITNRNSHIDLIIKYVQEKGGQNQNHKSSVRIIIKRYSQLNFKCFQQLKDMGNKQYIFKSNMYLSCKFDDLIYPHLKIRKEDKLSSQQELILLINQSNMTELPFFAQIIESMSKSRHLSKIIGHSASIFLVFLINDRGQFDEDARQIIINYKKYINKFDNEQILKPVNKIQILKDIFLKSFSQQNILSIEMIQFLIDNIINEQFVIDFTKIFLKEDITNIEIDIAIKNYFYYQLQNIQRNSFSFSMLLTFIQFRHNLQCNQLFYSLFPIIQKKINIIQIMTLQDLYNYNRVQFTFVAFDITDKIVRFFNHKTTPKLPIVAILSLVQFLPVPYKSIIWRQQWGTYRVHYDKFIRQININLHQIVDSRFLLQCPLDLLQDARFRNCYMEQSSKDVFLYAFTGVRKKVQELPQIQKLKILLKSMKSNAIDSLPKLRLIWKILTTKNRIQLDLNNMQTFYQVPLFNRILQLDETYKIYLENINRQANHQNIFKFKSQIFMNDKIGLKLSKMIQNLKRIQKLLDDLLKKQLDMIGQQQFNLQINKLKQMNNNQRIQGYQEYLNILNYINRIIEIYPIESKFKYKYRIQSILKEINQYPYFIDRQLISSNITLLINQLTTAKLKHITKSIDFNPYTSALLLSNINAMQSQQLIHDKLTFLKSQFHCEMEDFQNEYNTKQSPQAQVQYEKILYRFSRQLFKIIQKLNKNKNINIVYYQMFNITPYLYQIECNSKVQVMGRQQMRDMMINLQKDKKIHIILNGDDDRLIESVQKLFLMKQCLQDIKISEMTVSGYHSIIGILFILGVDKQTIIEQIVGISRLIKSNIFPSNEQDINLLQLLLQNKGNKHNRQMIQFNEIYLNIALKYKQIFKQIITLQKLLYNGIHDLYILINEYDQQQQQLNQQQKQLQILQFIKIIRQQIQLYYKKQQLIKQNYQMIKQKLNNNKIGIKFIIRFLYRNRQYQYNWFYIHIFKYQSIHLYYQYLMQIFHKYQIPIHTTISSFNNTHHLNLHFILANYLRNQIQVFNNQHHQYTRLIDLLMATASYPLFFPPHPINIIYQTNQQQIKYTLARSNKKICPKYNTQLYWSNIGINSIPFNTIQNLQNSKDHFICSFSFLNFSHMNIGLNKEVNNYKKIQSEQKRNLRAIDLLGMWWTKNKKLSVEMKQILFGSIFKSPFLYYYYIIQNNSYQMLLRQRNKRTILNINNELGNIDEKGKIIGSFIDNNKDNKILLRIKIINQQIQIQLLSIDEHIEIKYRQQFIKQGQIRQYYIEKLINIIIYIIKQESIVSYSLELSAQSIQQQQYYTIHIKQNQLVIHSISCNLSTKIIPINHITVQKYPLHPSFHHKKKIGNDSAKPSTCQTGDDQNHIKPQSKSLTLIKKQSFINDFQQLKFKVIEQIRHSQKQLNKPPQRNTLLQYLCCFKQKDNQHQIKQNK